MIPVPYGWLQLMQDVFDAPRGYSTRLWQHYTPSATFLYQLQLCDASAPSRQALEQRIRHLINLVCPHDLMVASLTASPEGKRRWREAVRFEEMVLLNLNHEGKWKW
jgi:hypothetical protein